MPLVSIFVHLKECWDACWGLHLGQAWFYPRERMLGCLLRAAFRPSMISVSLLTANFTQSPPVGLTLPVSDIIPIDNILWLASTFQLLLDLIAVHYGTDSSTWYTSAWANCSHPFIHLSLFIHLFILRSVPVYLHIHPSIRLCLFPYLF